MSNSYVASHLKDMNRKSVYKLITSAREISKAEISRRTGISAPTVIKIIDFLISNDFVVRAGEGTSALGRKPQILRFNPDAAFSIGVELEGGHLKIGVVNLDGDIKSLIKIPVAGDFEKIIKDGIAANIDKAVADAEISRKKILGAGIGIPGVLDVENYTVEFAPLIGIHDVTSYREMFEYLSDSLKLPIFIENDVNAAAIGEFISRGFEGMQELIYFSLGTGLGAGIILEGRLRRGTRRSAGEIGYTVFDRSFETSRKQAGWMESLINLKSLCEKWNLSSIDDVNTISSEDKSLLIDFISSNLALCISNLTMQIDVDNVVIGGIIAEKLGNELVKSVQKYVSRLCLFDTHVKSQKCPEPCITGMASIVTDIRLNEILAE